MNWKDYFQKLSLTLLPILLGGGILAALLEYYSRDRELDIKMVEIGIAILRVDPSSEEQTGPARDWAMRVINEHSKVDFTRSEMAALRMSPLRIGEGASPGVAGPAL